MTPTVSIQHVFKKYGDKTVLNDISLEAYPGQIIGYIGPNGAGKSTTVKILTGLIPDFEGSVTVNGLDLRTHALEIKRIIGYIPENAEIYDVLTPMEYLQFTGRLYDLSADVVQERAGRMLTAFGLGDVVNQRMDTFSKGMKQKVLITSGLLHNPSLIILDEPLSGLDANAVIVMKEIMSRLAREGKTLFYCSHMMDVVEKVSDRIMLINHGQIIANGTFAELRQNSGDSLEKIFAQLTGETNLESAAGAFVDAFDNPAGDPAAFDKAGPV
jgi:ABC-2 type transport system ATP-binding protein